MDKDYPIDELLLQLYQFYRVPFHQTIYSFLSGEEFVIQLMVRLGGQCTPGDIKSTMLVSSARVAAMLNNLEKKELIERKIDKEDRRRIIVSLTPRGEAHADIKAGEIRTLSQRAKNKLGRDDVQEFLRILRKMDSI